MTMEDVVRIVRDSGGEISHEAMARIGFIAGYDAGYKAAIEHAREIIARKDPSSEAAR